jgi:ribosomal protein S18 acetylase RimI-like enzyme
LKTRLAKIGDLAAVSDLARRAYERYVPLIGREPMPMIEDYAPRIAAGQVWLLEDETLAGMIVIEEREGALLIFSVAVAPERQGLGLGQKLLGFAEDVANKRGSGTIELFTNAKMERNIRIYRKCGYVETRRRAHPTLANTVVVYMEKKLGAAETRRSA